MATSWITIATGSVALQTPPRPVRAHDPVGEIAPMDVERGEREGYAEKISESETNQERIIAVRTVSDGFSHPQQTRDARNQTFAMRNARTVALHRSLVSSH